MEKVLERLGTTEGTTLAVKRDEGGKIRVASMLWEDARVILRDEVLVVSQRRRPPAMSPPTSSGALPRGEVLHSP
jgi:hypothetical protein